ncbi:hypothetical protein BV25DRAFT_831402 [Artomyces pyxidatus]|uniref:Uncharacterized protein n=1 Tax=Artomyces pyxidatus TaxID=48021 RepID=A0ACB8TGJ5_9AGAM|nr:hypothetical protein BV25DRAFT_831402 [Artomyces pyxidatus]
MLFKSSIASGVNVTPVPGYGRSQWCRGWPARRHSPPQHSQRRMCRRRLGIAVRKILIVGRGIDGSPVWGERAAWPVEMGLLMHLSTGMCIMLRSSRASMPEYSEMLGGALRPRSHSKQH